MVRPSHLRGPARCLFGQTGSHMHITEPGAPGSDFDARLNAALDRVVPPTPLFTSARYRSSLPAAGLVRRFVPALVGIAAVGITAISATAATGTANPAVWTERAASSIESMSHVPQSKPASTHSPNPQPSRGVGQGDGSASRRNTHSNKHGGGRFGGPGRAHRPAPKRHH